MGIHQRVRKRLLCTCDGNTEQDLRPQLPQSLSSAITCNKHWLCWLVPVLESKGTYVQKLWCDACIIQKLKQLALLAGHVQLVQYQYYMSISKSDATAANQNDSIQIQASQQRQRYEASHAVLLQKTDHHIRMSSLEWTEFQSEVMIMITYKRAV